MGKVSDFISVIISLRAISGTVREGYGATGIFAERLPVCSPLQRWLGQHLRLPAAHVPAMPSPHHTRTPAQSNLGAGDVDLLHPPRELELRKHKLKRLVQSPNSFFMDVKCPGCFSM